MFKWSGRGIAVSICTLSVLASSLAGPALAKREGEKLPSFFPRATSVEIQRQCSAHPDAPNTAVFANLDAAGLARLQAVTGQQQLAMVSDGRNQVVLRDDGVAPDVTSGDGRFSFLTTLDFNELYVRSQAEVRAAAAGKLDGITVFEGREVVGKQTLAPFDFTRFMACQMVPLTPTPVTLTPVNEDPEFWAYLGFSMFITLADPMGWGGPALQDPTRTVDPCNPSAGNPDGPWTFKTMMSEMSGSTAAETFVEDWLTLYTQDQTTAATNGFTVASVSKAQQFIDDWKTAGGTSTLDLDIAPFRLLAITPRVDLRQGGGGGYGSPPGPNPNAGELRFIFGAVNPLTCAPLDFSVIIEYGVPLTTCSQMRNWARDWLALTEDYWNGGSDEDYRVALQALTDQITVANANPSNPNGSALNQLRTNELSLGSSNAWRIREFHLSAGGALEQSTTDETPDASFKFANSAYFDALIQDPTITSIPLSYGPSPLPTVPFLGAEALVAFPNNAAWGSSSTLNFLGDPVLAQRRHDIALFTCDGCHSVETQTSQAHMLDPQPIGGGLGQLSGFLVGGGTFPTAGDPHIVTDPVTGEQRSFFDLERRLQDMQSLANSICGPVVAVEGFEMAEPPLTH